MKLIRELIEIPEQIHGGEFVLRLTEGVNDPETTLRDYVVTPQLTICFERALDLLKDATLNRRSKGAYLHGSFGAGKSHFMAVLDLLLAGNPHARSIPELAPVLARHSGWTEGRRFLLVPFHMIGAVSMEQAILGQYAEFVRRVHPQAPIPGVFASEKIFDDARRLRDSIGDEAFFAQLNGGRDGGGEWGELARPWDGESFDVALNAPYRSEERARLVGDLVDHIFTSARGSGEYVPLDDGLSIISRQARDLGYDAVVLFLDELVLWLASHAADPAFISREGQKVAKLVESQSAERPVPIVSFIARQRDLRELIGDNVPGAEQVSFADILRWWEARFDTIKLEDRNLPAIAQRRVLRVRDEAARIELDHAFDELARRKDVFETLQTTRADRRDFRQVYPFSPALVEALVGASSLLQRERTALRVMAQLLVNYREYLKLGDLVPVGDLWDAIAEGEEPFNEGTRTLFETARKLYVTRFLPMIEAEHKLSAEQARKMAWDEARARAFRASDRIIKTLLLAAMVPQVECFRELTAGRLAALNHGSIRTPLPGGEAVELLTRLRRWASQAGEIRLSDAPDPVISLELVGVDTRSIIEQAKSEDNAGNRRRKLRDLIFGEIGINPEDRLFIEHKFKWRGTDRTCDVMFDHISTMPAESFEGRGETWKVIIDLPIPPAGTERGPSDAEAQLEIWEKQDRSTNTIAWIPAHFTLKARNDLGQLVILDRILVGDRLDSYTQHLSLSDRVQARRLLENQRNQLNEQIKALLLGAYGIAADQSGLIDSSYQPEDRVKSLNTGLQLRPPVGATLRQAFENLLDQALRHQYPAHPDFKTEPSRANLGRLWGEIEGALAVPDHRVQIDRNLRQMTRDIALPLRMGQMGDDHFILDPDHWRLHFNRKIEEMRREGSGAALTVRKLREWMDDPTPWGLPALVQNLIILTFAAIENYSLFQHGGPFTDPAVESLKDDLDLRAVNLPSEEDWQEGCRRAGGILGLTAPQLRNAANVQRLADLIKKCCDEARAHCDRYHKDLQGAFAKLHLDTDKAARMRTASAVLAMVERIAHGGAGAKVIEALAHTEIETSIETMATSLSKAADLHGVIDRIQWDLAGILERIDDSRADAARLLLDSLKEAFTLDELAVGLAGKIAHIQSEAIKLLAPPPRTERRDEDEDRDEKIRADGTEKTKPRTGSARSLNLAGARQKLAELEGGLQQGESLLVELRWEIRKEDGQR